MSINIDTQDLVNYPGTVKRVVADHEAIVPVGEEGDEKYVMNFATNAYSNNTNRTAINDLYITKTRMGWSKSSGFTGSNDKFAVNASSHMLYIKIDATISGTKTINGESGFYKIILPYTTYGNSTAGEAISDDLEKAIRGIALTEQRSVYKPNSLTTSGVEPSGDTLVSADNGYAKAYKNASVEYSGGKFYIISGSMSELYSGYTKTAVKVAKVPGDGLYELLGFDQQWTSEYFDDTSVSEAVVTSTVSPGTTSITIGSDIGISVGDPLVIIQPADDNSSTYTKDYFIAVSGTTGSTVMAASSAITNSYTANRAKIQILREQDPDGVPTSWVQDIDQLVRYGVKYMTFEIDYSS